MTDERLETLAVGTAASLFFLAFHSTYYNFDGVACAVAVDLGNPRYLAHGNHLLYGLAGFAFDRAWRLFGYRGPALLVLQTLDSLLGGATVAAVWRLLARARARPLARIAACAGLALSQAFWLWSLEAQVYMLSALFLVLAATQALEPSPRPGRLGFWHAMACLGHVGAVMFWPASAYALWRSRAGRRGALACAGAWTLTLGAAYAAAGAFFVKPSGFADARVWLLGSAALKVDHSFTWYGGYSWSGLKDWAVMSSRIFSDSGLLGLGGLALAALGAWRSRRGHEVRTVLLWLAGYAVLFTSWQPSIMVYRVVDLPALWILTALGLSAAGPALLGAAAVFVAALGVFNWRAAIAPACDPARNAVYEDSLWIGGVTPDDAWIVSSGLYQVYAPYFAHRRPLNLRYFDRQPQALSARLDALAKAGEPVFVPSSVMAADPWSAQPLRAYGLTEAGRRGQTVLYRVMKGKPSGSRTKKLKTAAADKKGPNGIGSDLVSRPRAMSQTP